MTKLLLASILLMGAAGIARADSDDHPGPDWISVSRVAHDLHEQGYTQISQIEADDGLWEAKAAWQGASYEVKVDPYSGDVVKRELDDD